MQSSDFFRKKCEFMEFVTVEPLQNDVPNGVRELRELLKKKNWTYATFSMEIKIFN